jgi:2-oxoglutarate dehydrogenase E2 component (dihydrolipoamide succinyltransferase)
MSLEIKVPPVGESITEVTLSSWLKKDGDTVAMDEAIAELESDKATFELTAEKAGILKTIAKEGDVLAIGAVVCSIEEGGAAASAPKAEAAPAKTEAAPVAAAAEKGATYASGTPSPAAAKILAEKGVEATAVSGTGVNGRITKEDALSIDKASENPQTRTAVAATAPAPAAAPVKAGERVSVAKKCRLCVKRLLNVCYG